VFVQFADRGIWNRVRSRLGSTLKIGKRKLERRDVLFALGVVLVAGIYYTVIEEAVRHYWWEQRIRVERDVQRLINPGVFTPTDCTQTFTDGDPEASRCPNSI
jgi:hypothetical protein